MAEPPSNNNAGTGRGDESLTSTASDAVRGARTGAQVGSKVGGAHGAAAGAVLGAGKSLVKNRKVRTGLVIAVVLLVLPSLVLPLLIGSMVGGALVSQGQREDHIVASTAEADGLTPEDIEGYKEAAVSSGTHWAWLAAIDRAAGDWSGPGNPPYGVESVAKINESTGGEVETLEDVEDPAKVGYTVGRAFTSSLSEGFPDVDPHGLDTGVGVIIDPSNPSTTIRAVDESNPDAVAGHEATKEGFTKVLSEMPLTVASKSEEVFDTAFRWVVGQESQSGASACTPVTTDPPAAGEDDVDEGEGPAAADTGEADGDTPSVYGFNDDQIENVATIVAIGKSLKLPERAWQIAIMTVLVESEALNLKFGHADSQGLFQQRPSAGWGTVAEITDPEKAARAFFGKADHTDNPGLTDIKGWKTMTMGDAAQAVQASAIPGAYAKREAEAKRLLKGVAGTAAASAVGDTGDCSPQALGDFADCPPTGWDDLETPAALGKQIPPDALRTLRCGHEAFPQFTDVHTYGQRPIAADEHGTGRAVDWMVPGGWKDQDGRKVATEMANWLVKNRKPLGVQYIIWDNKIWNAERDPANAEFPDGWRDYGVCSPPNGTAESCGPTAAHLDHVHVTLYGDKGVVDSGTNLADGKWTLPLKDNYVLAPGVCTAGTPCWGYNGHTGQDFSSNADLPVLVVAGGKVTTTKVICPDLTNAQRENNEGCSYGRYVVIDHGGGVETLYAHLNGFASGLKVGDTVKAGQEIGLLGSQGNSTGPHLHLEVRKSGAVVNPVEYLEQQGVPVRCAPTMQTITGNIPAGKC